MKTNPAVRIALVTGGASGIGFAIAAKFIQSGIRTIIVGRDQQKLDAAKMELGPDCHAIQKDLNDLAAIPANHGLDKLVQRLDALYGENASLKVFRHDNASIVQMTVPRS